MGEHGRGYIRYPNGNSLDAEFVAGKIMGHGVFRYASGDQREGFFVDNILDGQVIFTRNDGTTVIEKWLKGEKVDSDEADVSTTETNSIKTNIESQEDIKIILNDDRESLPHIADILARGGHTKNNFWKPAKQLDSNPQISQLSKIVKSRSRSLLFEIYS